MARTTSFQWQPNGKILAFVLLFLPVTIGLGFWQLARAEEKAEILAQQEARAQLAPLDNPEIARVSEPHLRRFALQVEFDAERWLLLDNRVRQGQPGYEVLGIAHLANTDRLVLINRGWVPASLDRARLPDIEAPQGVVEISGYIYAPDQSYFALGEQSWSGTWPERIQNPDLSMISEHLTDGSRLLPLQLRLSATDPHAFLAEWQVVNQLPERHVGYAVQWFVMGFALMILGIFANSNLGQIIATKRD